MPTQSAYTIADDRFSGSPLQQATRLLGPSAAVRITARLRRSMLDRALTDGTDLAASPLLAARAAQLGSASTRARAVSPCSMSSSRMAPGPAYTDQRGDVLALQVKVTRAGLTG